MSILLISGSTRAGSTNTAVLRTAAAVDPDTVLHTGLAELPAFDPDDDVDPLPGPVARLRSLLADAEGVLVCTPEYAGALPGAMKNLLDWTVGGTGFRGKPTGWVNASSPAAPTGGAGAHRELATVLAYVEARIVAGACRRVALGRGDVGADGLVDAARGEVTAALRALREAAAAVPRP